MSTYFIGTCIYEFPNLYTQWHSQRIAALKQGRAEQEVGPLGAPPTDPAATVVQADQARRALARLPDRRRRIIAKLVADGYTQDEIAEALRASGFPTETTNAVRGAWQRRLNRSRQERELDDD
ncbi:hypothetical protein OHS58_05735 [Amycolatopsis sp. NBC_00348]|uniref:RNA polymerase sigma factor n=1 Tax=Amycolatopsis sp. NBC_00348 TaxID=2975956 RepID=UPI002E2531C4